MDKNVTINGRNLFSMELKSTVAAYWGTCKDILHAAEVSLIVNQPMVHISLNPYAKPFLSLQYNPVAHNGSTPELSMISNNDIKESSSAIVEAISNSQTIDTGSLNNTFNKNVDPNVVLSHLKSLKVKNPNRMIIAYLNINSITSKFDQLSNLIITTVNILEVSETKLDDSFPQCQFKISGFSQPYRLDRNRNGGGGNDFCSERVTQ